MDGSEQLKEAARAFCAKYSLSERKQPVRIYDLFMFNDELDMLEVRSLEHHLVLPEHHYCWLNPTSQITDNCTHGLVPHAQPTNCIKTSPPYVLNAQEHCWEAVNAARFSQSFKE